MDKLLDDLQPPLNKDQLNKNLVPWLNDLRMCQNTVNSILSLTSQSQWVENLKLRWHLIQAMKIFLEHVLLRHTKVPVKYARRLEIVSIYMEGGSYDGSLYSFCVLVIEAVWTRLS